MHRVTRALKSRTRGYARSVNFASIRGIFARVITRALDELDMCNACPRHRRVAVASSRAVYYVECKINDAEISISD